MTEKGLWRKPLEITVTQERIVFFTKQLLPVPVGLGKQIDYRDFWNKVKDSEKFQELLDKIKELSSQKIPEIGRTEFLKDWNEGSNDYKNGLDTLFKNNLKLFTLAECAENQGTYIPRIEETIKILCQIPAWVVPGPGAYFCNDPEQFLSAEYDNSTDAVISEKNDING